MSFNWIENCLQGDSARFLGVVEKLGLPNQKMEDWRYTNVRGLFAGDWAIAEVGKISLGDLVTRIHDRAGDVVRVVFSNGIFLGLEGVCSGVVVEVVGGQDGDSKVLVGQDVFSDGEEAIVALCAGVSSQTLRIRIGGVDGAKIEILHFATEGHKSRVSGCSVFVELLAGASATVTERFIDCEIGDYLRLNNTQLRVGKGSKMAWVREIAEGSQARHCGVFHVRVEEAADFRSLFRTVGGAVVRSVPSVVLLGERARVGLHGVTVADGVMQVDNTTLLDHRVANCESRELFRGVYRGHARGAFTGKVRVHKNAQKTNAYQQNNALMLSEEAEFNSRPVLQIWADDVKCTHGATVGAIDEDALRYMRARGLGRVEAEELLTEAFLAEVESSFLSQ